MTIQTDLDDNIPDRPKLSQMLQVLRPFKRRWIIMLLVSFVGMGLYVQIPLGIQLMIRGIVNTNVVEIWQGFFWLLGVVVLDAIGLYFRFRYGYYYLSCHLIYNLRRQVVVKALQHSFRFMDHNRSGDLVATATNDVQTVAEFFAFQFQNIFTYSVQLVVITVILYMISPTLVLILACFFPGMLVLVLYYQRKIHPITYHQRTIFGRLTSRLQQNIAGIQLVKSFNNEDYETDKFKVINQEYSDSSWKVANLSSIIQPSMDFIWNMARLVLIGAGIYLLLEQTSLAMNLTVDQMVAFIPALDMFLWPITFLSWMGGEYGRIQAGYGRLKRIFDEPIDVIEKKDAIVLPRLDGAISYNHVSFSYIPNKPVFRDISFSIPAGSTVAFLGATGSGKSTIIHLLTRSYDIQTGTILLDKKYNLTDVNLDSFLTQVGLVAQDPFLFQQTFLENLTHGLPTYTMEDVIDACKKADIYNFIMEKEKKFDTMIGERGVTLSGGQKQRVTIARALLRHPRILILDAATSSVDVDTEYEILMSLKRIFGQCTTIIITQRLSTVRNADKIFVLDKGEIIEEGTHTELMALNKSYANLYSSLKFKEKPNTEKHE